MVQLSAAGMEFSSLINIIEILEIFAIFIDFLEILDNTINRRGDVAFTAKGFCI